MGDMYCTKDEMNSNEGRIYLTKCKMFCAKGKIIMIPVILYSQWLWCCLAFGTVKKITQNCFRQFNSRIPSRSQYRYCYWYFMFMSGTEVIDWDEE